MAGATRRRTTSIQATLWPATLWKKERRLLFLSLFLAASGMAACRVPDLSTFAARPDAVEAREILDTLARKDVSAVVARVDESQRTPELESSLQALAARFPGGAPTSVRMVGYQANVEKMVGGPSTETSKVTFESNYDDSYVLSNVVLRRIDDGARRIVGLHTQALPASIEVLNAFSLGDMGLVQYGFLLAMIAVAATTVAALVVWFRRRRVTARRWWWLLAIVVGAFKLSVNWVTGAWAIQALTIQFFSLSALRDGLFGPWIFSFSIPAGAIAFLINSRRAQRTPLQEPLAPSAPP